MDEVIGSRTHLRSESWSREHIICVFYRFYSTLLLLLFLLLSFGLSGFFLGHILIFAGHHFQLEGILFSTEASYNQERARGGERERERISKLGRN